MEKGKILATISLILLTTACTTTISTEIKKDVVEPNETLTESQEPQTYFGFIEKLPLEKQNGDFSYAVQGDDGTQTNLTSCDKRAKGIWDEVLSLSDKETRATVYGTEKTGGVCVTGVSLYFGENNDQLAGLIKQLPLEKQYGDFSYVIEFIDGTQTGITNCDKRTEGLWNQALSLAGTETHVDLYGSRKTGGVCVNGIVIK